MKISQRKMIQAILTVLYLSLPVSQGQGRHHITIILTFIYNNLIDILCTLCGLLCYVMFGTGTGGLLCDDDVSSSVMSSQTQSRGEMGRS